MLKANDSTLNSRVFAFLLPWGRVLLTVIFCHGCCSCANGKYCRPSPLRPMWVKNLSSSWIIYWCAGYIADNHNVSHSNFVSKITIFRTRDIRCDDRALCGKMYFNLCRESLVARMHSVHADCESEQCNFTPIIVPLHRSIANYTLSAICTEEANLLMLYHSSHNFNRDIERPKYCSLKCSANKMSSNKTPNQKLE